MKAAVLREYKLQNSNNLLHPISATLLLINNRLRVKSPAKPTQKKFDSKFHFVYKLCYGLYSIFIQNIWVFLLFGKKLPKKTTKYLSIFVLQRNTSGHPKKSHKYFFFSKPIKSHELNCFPN